MGVDANALAAAVLPEFPVAWNWPPGAQNRVWLDALCQGFVAMWQAGAMSPGPGPPPGPNLHTHSLTALAAAMMEAPALALEYSSHADGFVSTISQQTAAFLISNVAMDVQDGTAPHVHGFVSFGSFGALKSAIVSNAAVSGIAIAPFAEAWAKGLIGHLGSTASMGSSAGAGHAHVLQ